MIEIGNIKCPCCCKEVYMLHFWKKMDNTYFHICEKCKKKNAFSERELISIGYHKGVEETKEKLIKALEKDD